MGSTENPWEFGYETVDDVVLGDLEVGSILGFICSAGVVILFQAYGFFLTFFMVCVSHAVYYGSLAGVGILLGLASPSIGDSLMESAREDLKAYVPILSLTIGIAGWLLFLFSLSRYQRLRATAELMLRPASGTRYNTTTTV